MEQGTYSDYGGGHYLEETKGTGSEAKEIDRIGGIIRPPGLHPPVEVAYRFVPPREYHLSPSCEVQPTASSSSSLSVQHASSSVSAAATIPSLRTASRDKRRAPPQPGLRSTCTSCARSSIILL
ncbi:unnamed protein product, partial [Discosporangium mesarthrocarpum]